MEPSLVETIAVFGAGYVGLTTACGLAEAGHAVVGYDIDARKLAGLSAGECPVQERGLGELLTRNLHAGRLRFTADLRDAVLSSHTLMLCVPTPAGDDGAADTRIVSHLVEQIAAVVRGEADRRRILVVKSTVPPGTSDALADRFADAPLDFAVNPEFLKEGSAVDDFLRPDRIVIGAAGEAVAEAMRRVYAPFVRNEHPVLVVSRTGAEMIKYAANIMLAGRISMINELANICRLLGVDVNEVRRGIGYDRRIGFEFLYPGIGFGGSCLPKDLEAMIRLANSFSYKARLLEAVAAVNNDQRMTLVGWIHELLGINLSQATIAIWGLAFKPGTDDIRQAPALTIIDSLLAAGARLRVSDPAANQAVRAVFGDRLEYFEDHYQAVEGADMLVICTEWPQFRRPDLARVRAALRRPLILDGRNLFEPTLMGRWGFEYHSIGRPAAIQPPAP